MGIEDFHFRKPLSGTLSLSDHFIYLGGLIAPDAHDEQRPPLVHSSHTRRARAPSSRYGGTVPHSPHHPITPIVICCCPDFMYSSSLPSYIHPFSFTCFFVALAYIGAMCT